MPRLRQTMFFHSPLLPHSAGNDGNWRLDTSGLLGYNLTVGSMLSDHS